jgi:formate dehydrogenase major subunit
MISVTIDGRRLEGRSGETILDVARRSGIPIPALCAEERLSPFDSCGVCTVEIEGRGVAKACSTPIVDDMVIQTDTPAARDVRRTALELLLSDHWGDCVAPCQQACPAHTDCQAYVCLAGNGRFADALKVLYEYLPLPASFGRICPAPCEDACRRQVAEEPVQIRHMKRFLGDLSSSYVPTVDAETGKRVVVVGGGPAGLSAAYFLRRRGHRVVVLDVMPHMGGMLRYGIPEYRLPQSVIDRELDVLVRMGIEFRNGVRLGRDVTLGGLEAEFDAIFLGLGAWGTRSMGLPGEDHRSVVQGTEFLRQVNEGARPDLPQRVAVIGGGNTAMDAARCARRLGAEVAVLYRRTQEEMPALAHEVQEALDEGIRLSFLTQPVEFVADDRRLQGIRCVRMELGEPDESGRRRPLPIDGSEFMIDVGAVLLAVGQSVDTTCLRGSGVDVTKWGNIAMDEATGQTSKPNVFAGGDAVTGPSIAVEAAGAGHRAADAMDRFLRGEDVSALPLKYVHVKYDVTREDIGNPATAPRIRTPVRSVDERLGSFDEYETGLSAGQAVSAGQRCLECGCMAFDDCALRDYAAASEASQDTYVGEGTRALRDERHPFIVRKVGKCISCGRCLRVCADVCGISAIDFVGRGMKTEVQAPFNRAWQDSDCVACGACVDACPTGALYDRTVLEKQVPLDLEAIQTTCGLCGLGCDIAVLSLNGAYMRTAPAASSDVLCARGRYGWHTLRGVQRITSPMIRRGSALVEVTWDEALQEAAQRLSSARGNTVVFGTGSLTCEEGWIATKIAEQLSAGPPLLDVHARRCPIDIGADQIQDLSSLHEAAALVVVIGPRASYESVALHAKLRRAIGEGAVLVSVGAQVPGAHAEILLDELPLLLDGLALAREKGNVTAPDDPRLPSALIRTPEGSGLRRLVLVVQERTISPASLEHVGRFLVQTDEARLVVIPAQANAVGLRALGFDEEFRTSARAWLAIGADPVATEVGRQNLPKVETLVAISALPTMTTARAQVVFPMRLPYETRGSLIAASGEKRFSITGRSAIKDETWDVLLRLAAAVGAGPLPNTFETLTEAASDAVARGPRGITAANATPVGLARVIEWRLTEFGIQQ